MKNGENEARGAQQASSRAIVVEAAAAPVGRRDVAALVGALAGLIATGCLNDAEGGESIEDLGSSAEALTGTSLRWVDTVLGAVPTEPPSPLPGDLATQNSANLGGAIMVFAKGCVTAGDGGGGIFYWDSTSATDDGGTVIVPASGGGCWKRVFSGAINVMWFGAQGNGDPVTPTSGDETAIRKALAAATAIGGALRTSIPVTGASRTYAVFGDTVLAANAQLQDISLKQFAPAVSDRRTLTTNGGNNIKLVRVKVNRNGDGMSGSSDFAAAGIWIHQGSGHHFEDVEVWGDDQGSGFVVWEASNFDVERLHVHDIKYKGPGIDDDRVQGFWFNACSDFRVIAPKVHDLGGDDDTGYTTKRSRNAFGGCHNFSLIDAQVWNVDQGIDLTGGPANNTNFRILGGSVRDCYSAGFKFANTANGGLVIGATAERCDMYGFFAAGPSECNTPLMTGDITFAHCLALDTGSTRLFIRPDMPRRPAGFAVEVNDYDRSISPLGIRFVDCTALDRQQDPTMRYGFVNEVPAPDSAAVAPDPECPPPSSPAPPPPAPQQLPPDGRYNECIDCVSIGHSDTGSPTWKMHRAFCQVRLAASQLIANGVWGEVVNWNGEDHDEGAMHAGDDERYVYARQPGLYELIVSLEFAFGATGGRGLRLLRNDVEVPGTRLRRPPSTSGGDETRIVLTWQLLCAAGDRLSVEAFQQSGDGLALTTASRMIVTKIDNTGPEA